MFCKRVGVAVLMYGRGCLNFVHLLTNGVTVYIDNKCKHQCLVSASIEEWV